MHIDAEDYLIHAYHRDSHPAERHILYRDCAVGLAAARKIQKKIQSKHEDWTVVIYHKSQGGARTLVD